jgi:sugar phosphate permease
MQSSDARAEARVKLEPGGIIERSGARWILLLLCCILHAINFADRANIGIAIPSLRTEFHMTGAQLGQMGSLFFLGYFIFQIPAGWAVSTWGVRGFISCTIVAFSVFTALIGTAVSGVMVKWFRVALGIVEAPTVVASNGSIKTWFPAKERGTALGCLTGATTLAVGLTPIFASWILKDWGWRYIFFIFAIPGVILAGFWYWFVRRYPQESKYVNQKELEYIRTAVPTRGKKTAAIGAIGWFDKFLRAKPVAFLEENRRIFAARNIWGVFLVYLFIQIIFYGVSFWVPSYLREAKHFSIMQSGALAAVPWLGGVIGNFFGGWISDKLLYGRRKPMMLIAGLGTAFGMWSILAATSTGGLTVALFITGIFANIGWSSYFSFPMAFTTAKTYPVAISVMIMGGNIGAFISPWTLGWLLDRYKNNYDVIFIFMGVAAILSLICALAFLDEPVNMPSDGRPAVI